MKGIRILPIILTCGSLFASLDFAIAQSTAFTYQGRLNDGSGPANGVYDLRFAIYDSTKIIGGPLTNPAVAISNGVFTVQLDFGAGVFDGNDRWLEIGVRTNGGGSFAALNPRQPITAAPYAIAAGDVTGANIARLNVPNTATQASGHPVVTTGFITGAVVDNGGSGYTVPPPVTVNDTTGSGAIITAAMSNGVVVNLAVSSAGSGYSSGATLTIGAPPPNNYQVFVTSNFFPNVNVFTNPANVFAGNGAGLGGVWKLGGNAGADPAIGNFIGTSDNQPLEVRVNGQRAWRLEPNTNGAPNVIGGSPINFVSNGVVGATIAGGGATDYFDSAYSNSVTGDFGTVSGGRQNIAGPRATVGGGDGNTASNFDATVSGGYLNTAGGIYSTVAGGDQNIASGDYYSTVGGGHGNTASGRSTIVGGGEANTSSGTMAIVGGGFLNTCSGNYSTVAGGLQNTNSGYSAAVSGGYINTVSGDYGTVSGGYDNTASGALAATVTGGIGNTASGSYATVGGGENNIASGDLSFASGHDALAAHLCSFVWSDFSGGTFSSTANNQFSVRAAGGIRFAGDVELDSSTYHHLWMSGGNSDGYLYGSFPKFADGIHLGYNYYADASGGNHVIRSDGATSRITAGYGSVGIYVGGVNAAPTTQRLYADGTGVTVNGTFNNNSDRNAKQDFAPVSPAHILEKVAQLPLSEWSYKEDATTRHLGPMAQDFYSTFNIGTDDKHIAPIDEGGVALAAIQGLNRKLSEKDAEIQDLKTRLEKLEQLLSARK